MNEGLLGTFASHEFLRRLGDRHLMLLASGAKPFTAGPGEYLGREGEAAKAFYLIQSGHVEVGTQRAKGGEAIVQTVGPGEVVGWSWILPPHRWQFDSRAVDTVRGIAFDAEWLREKCEQDHELGYQLLNELLAVVASRLVSSWRQRAGMQS
ncbi:MAG TPA: cyclic nucleotide-binding domain-containing protein [Gemmataceae bacterium]|nr:cyclic nucleotide-binding domain-containing protein [Gemmataceae bacterium]